MGVDAHGDVRAGVAHQALGGLDVHAGVVEHGDIGVPQVVGADVEAGPGRGVLVRAAARADGGLCVAVQDVAHGVEPGGPAGGPDRLCDLLPFGAGADPGIGQPGAVCEHSAQRGQDGHIPHGGGRLGIAQHSGVRLKVHAVADVDHAGLEIHIVPGKGERLAPAEASKQHQHGPQPSPVRGPVAGDQRDLLMGEGPVRAAARAGPVDAGAGIKYDDAVGDGRAEDHLRGDPQLGHRGFAVVRHLIREVLDVHLPHVAQADGSQRGAQLLRVQTVNGVGGVPGPGAVGLKPGVDPGGEGLRLRGHVQAFPLGAAELFRLDLGFPQGFAVEGLADPLAGGGIRAGVHPDAPAAVTGEVALL